VSLKNGQRPLRLVIRLCRALSKSLTKEIGPIKGGYREEHGFLVVHAVVAGSLHRSFPGRACRVWSSGLVADSQTKRRGLCRTDYILLCVQASSDELS